MALARSASGPGGLSINTSSANSLFGSSDTPAPAGGMFGSTATSKPSGGLFGTSSTGTTAPQTGGLFGSTSTSTQPQAGGLFGGAAGTSAGGLFGSANTTTNTQSQTGGPSGSTTTTSAPVAGGLFGTTTSSAPAAGGLFGSTATASSAPQAGGLFGSATSQAPQAGTLFGSTATTSQPQTGGLFGSSTAQPAQSGGGLFGNLNSNQNKPATSLFGGLGTQNQQSQPQQSSMFSSSQNQPQAQSSFLGGGLSLGQTNNQNQQTVPGVRIDLTNLRGTTRFNDLHEDLQKEISKLDDIIQGQIKLRNDCEAIVSSHDSQLAHIPNDVGLMSRKLVGVESAILEDVKAIFTVRELIKTDAAHAKLSFAAIDNLKLPPQYHNTGMWSTKASENRSQSDSGEDAEDIVGLFSKTADELSATLAKYQTSITEIEQHLRGLEASSAQQINSFVAKRRGGYGGTEDPIAELAAALREFEQSILGVAGKVGGAREGMQNLQLGEFAASTNGRNVNGKRNGIY